MMCEFVHGGSQISENNVFSFVASSSIVSISHVFFISVDLITIRSVIVDSSFFSALLLLC